MPHLLSLSSRATEVPQERPAQWEAPASPQPPPATTREKATEQWRLSIAKNKQMNKIIFKNFQVILKRSWDEQPPTKRSPRFLFQSHMTTMWLSSSEWLRDQDWKQNKAEKQLYLIGKLENRTISCWVNIHNHVSQKWWLLNYHTTFIIKNKALFANYLGQRSWFGF